MACGKGEWPSTGDAGVPWPAAQHVDEQVRAQVAQRDAPVRQMFAALALQWMHGGDEAQPHVAPEHRVAAICACGMYMYTLVVVFGKHGHGML